jgi:apolipoprotein D and lipocalin family protein
MKKRNTVAAAGVVASAVCLCTSICITSAFAAKIYSDPPEVEVADYVDVQKFMGTWYLIAEIPNFFERACAGGQTAEYSLNPDGSVSVINSCFRKSGASYSRRAKAFVVDEETNAKLEVGFVPLFNYRFFRGDYWIMEVGDDYEYAVVGHPTREYGWVLSRECDIEDTLLEDIFELLEEQYYDTDDFVLIDQSRNGCPAMQ